MPTVVLLIYHGVSHFNACFKMARIMSHKYHVVFAGLDLFKRYVEAQGFPYYALHSVPFGLGFEQWLNVQEKKKFIYFQTVKDRWTQRLFKLREAELSHLLDQVRPQCVLIDSLQSTDFVVVYPYAKKHAIRIGFVQTFLPQVVRWNCPPINSLVLPGDRLGIIKASAAFFIIRFLKLCVVQLKFFGMTNSRIIRKRMRVNQVSPHYSSKAFVPFGVVFNHIHEFILSPREFDFPGNTSSAYEHYAGFLLDEHRKENFDPQYRGINEKLKNNSAALIYCSFGTVLTEDTKAVDAFIQKLINVVNKKKYVLIVSLQIHKQEYEFPTQAENVYFMRMAPQLEILSKASLFITHGGFNSIKESVYAGVPLLVYPLNSVLDQKGNSTRVIFHKLGLRGDLRKDSETLIQQKMEELLINPIYKEKLEALKTTDRSYTPEKFMQLMDRLEPLK